MGCAGSAPARGAGGQRRAVGMEAAGRAAPGEAEVRRVEIEEEDVTSVVEPRVRADDAVGPETVVIMPEKQAAAERGKEPAETSATAATSRRKKRKGRGRDKAAPPPPAADAASDSGSSTSSSDYLHAFPHQRSLSEPFGFGLMRELPADDKRQTLVDMLRDDDNDDVEGAAALPRAPHPSPRRQPYQAAGSEPLNLSSSAPLPQLSMARLGVLQNTVSEGLRRLQEREQQRHAVPKLALDEVLDHHRQRVEVIRRRHARATQAASSAPVSPGQRGRRRRLSGGRAAPESLPVSPRRRQRADSPRKPPVPKAPRGRAGGGGRRRGKYLPSGAPIAGGRAEDAVGAMRRLLQIEKEMLEGSARREEREAAENDRRNLEEREASGSRLLSDIAEAERGLAEGSWSPRGARAAAARRKSAVRAAGRTQLNPRARPDKSVRRVPVAAWESRRGGGSKAAAAATSATGEKGAKRKKKKVKRRI